MLLAFDTASPTVSVAVYDDQADDPASRVRADLASGEPMQHGEQLVPLIERALDRAGVVRHDLTAVAVGAGPGPFTGLRVGVVTARTLGFALDVPVYACCSLDALAVQAVDEGRVEGPFLVAADARRREVFWASYAADGARLGDPAVDRPDLVAGDLAVDLAAAPVVGEGAVLYPEAFPFAVGPRRPSAAHLARAVAEERVVLLDPEPLYLRRPDAREPGPPKPVS